MQSTASADAATLFELGNALLGRGRVEAAIDAFRKCLSAAPDHSGTNYNLANCLLRAGRPAEAIDAYLSCIRRDPEFGPAYVNLADLLRRLGFLAQARSMAETGLRLLPELVDAKTCLASVLHDLGEHEGAALLYRQALEREAKPDILTSLGGTLRAMGQLTEALAIHERAVTIAPGDAEARFSRALTLLSTGDFERGLLEYEWRWLRPDCPPRALGKWWKGEPPTGRTILLHAEQGISDTLQLVRYAPLIAQNGGRVVMEVQPELVELIRGIPEIAEVVPQGQALPPYDMQCPLLSLPRVFGTRLETIPDCVPYLHTDPGLSANWRCRLPDESVLRVGLCLSAGREEPNGGAGSIDRRRSVPPDAFASFMNIAGVRFVGLGDAPIGDMCDLMHATKDFSDTAALIANLDLVISVDTAAAHLAGALGRPVWLLAPCDSHWRWLHGREDSPWYPTMRIYRQKRPLEWDCVLAAVRRNLTTLAETAARANRKRLPAD
jgi:Flp pilus assembly protein TadD